MRSRIRNLFLSVALANVAVVAFAEEQNSGNSAEAVTWSPDAIPSVINPSSNTSLSHWESYKEGNWRPSQDQMLEDPILKGAIDIHAHFGPDVYHRQWDVFDIARRAQERGMRGIVIKSHWTASADLASLAREYAAPNLEVWGSLSLNTTVGGLNPMAVRAFAETEGSFGRVVWFPTHDSQHEVTVQEATRPYVRVSKDGVLLPQVFEILDLIAKYDLTLATGHVTPDEMLKIVAEARKRGIDRIIITHPGLGPMFTDPSVEQIKQVAAMGAYPEVVATMLSPRARAETIAMMRAVGPEHLILSTDSGLTGTPNHTDAFVLAARVLREEGFTENELNLMVKINPAKVLGLPVNQ
jgi:hypothetical protein